MQSDTSQKALRGVSPLGITTLTALGVVFGDIGTSPLYALRECFHGPHSIPLNEVNVMGVLSLIVWSLILVISIKYLLFVLRADNRGEGGILALTALVAPRAQASLKGTRGILIIVGLFGAALLYGDGVITPAISVLSAVEGLKVATPFFEPYVIIITTVILVGLFLIQSSGTARIGKLFGPIILLWFATIALLGIKGIVEAPQVLRSVNPSYALEFFFTRPKEGFVVLGSVFLVVTGGEALYADLGHFGRHAIQLGWFVVALPSLVLQYFGQGALLLTNPSAIENPFYLLAPSWALYPLVGIATMATIIASQAVITGAFSLSQQASQLGFLPRMEVKHTSEREIGQVYVPMINWALLLGTLYLVFEFRSSSRLAAAYGIAVTTTMFITSILTFVVMRRKWEWSLVGAVSLTLIFLTVDLAFFGANSMKIPDGGWFPLVLASGVFLLMITWKRGRKILAQQLMARTVSQDKFVKEVVQNCKTRVPGTAIFLSATAKGIPIALTKNNEHNHILHEKIILLTMTTQEVPHVPNKDRVQFAEVVPGFYRVVAQYGFMETPHVPELLKLCEEKGLKFDMESATFFLGRETLIASNRTEMPKWQEKIFAFMAQNAQRATDYFKIPSDKAIEIGTVVDM
ncbi:MAG: potassium transporter Kup [Deltaproteobacteria bacterium]|nr:potassium transporter Kup [Deltaproteobacteria bacterium]